jgi:hypothetical protein
MLSVGLALVVLLLVVEVLVVLEPEFVEFDVELEVEVLEPALVVVVLEVLDAVTEATLALLLEEPPPPQPANPTASASTANNPWTLFLPIELVTLPWRATRPR